MPFAFGRVRRRIALLRAHPFVVGQFIARQLPIYFLKLHETEPTGCGSEAVIIFKIDTCGSVENHTCLLW